MVETSRDKLIDFRNTLDGALTEMKNSDTIINRLKRKIAGLNKVLARETVVTDEETMSFNNMGLVVSYGLSAEDVKREMLKKAANKLAYVLIEENLIEPEWRENTQPAYDRTQLTLRTRLRVLRPETAEEKAERENGQV